MIFDLGNAPKAERKAEPPKKKEKKGDKAADAPAEAAKSTPAAAEGKTEGKPAKEKKEKKKDAGDAKKGGKAAAAPAEDAGEPVPSMIDLRVGHIVDGECRKNMLTGVFNMLSSQEASGCGWPLHRSKNAGSHCEASRMLTMLLANRHWGGDRSQDCGLRISALYPN